MVAFTDLHYAQMLSGRLENFRIRHTNPYKINFRCPICGDSQKSRTKSRGWLLEKDNKFLFYCHNCGASHGFQNFLKTIDPLLYNDYVAEKFIQKDKKDSVDGLDKFKSDTGKKLSTLKENPLKKIKKVSQLSHTHAIKTYISSRQIPARHHYRLYYVKSFKSWINGIIPNKFDNLDKDEPRLVIPFFDKEKKVFGVSARGFNPNGVRYLTIMFEDRPKVFGLDTVDFNKQYFVVEGALDSLFLSNALAMAGADGNVSAFEKIENAVFVFDAEPRNKEIHQRMEKMIKQGHNICIWPSNVKGKDINEMILNGERDVEQIIRKNTYKGLEANLRLQRWRKT
jgi:transcription elongation factor Elf1